MFWPDVSVLLWVKKFAFLKEVKFKKILAYRILILNAHDSKMFLRLVIFLITFLKILHGKKTICRVTCGTYVITCRVYIIHVIRMFKMSLYVADVQCTCYT